MHCKGSGHKLGTPRVWITLLIVAVELPSFRGQVNARVASSLLPLG